MNNNQVFYKRFCRKMNRFLTPLELKEHQCFKKGKKKDRPCSLMQRIPIYQKK
jgi:hypothetical protein